MTSPRSSAGLPDPRPRLYVVALSHLDTQWRWTVRDTATRFLPATVDDNEALFARHPRYSLSFEGAWRYRLLGLHHPERLERVRRLVARGRWHPAGAAVEAFDTLLPSPESILRQIHYGQRWFAHELGRESADLFLPDCFGFSAALPTLAAHAGVVGFSTQKLRRGGLMRAAFGIPFAYGRWRGADGSELLAALDPGEYSARIESDLSRDPEWRRRFDELAARGRAPLLLTYAGCGDRGGAPPEESIAALERSLDGDGPIEIRHAASDRIFLETAPAERQRLPVHEGELLLRLHGTGCYTAKGALKSWNRRNERLARAAEAATAAVRTIGRPAPSRRLEEAWWRFLVHQMHDDLTGTSIPAAYRISLADEALAANELAEILLDALGRVSLDLDRSGPGRPLVLFNPLGLERSELIEIPAPSGATPRVIDPEGRPAPAQGGVGGDGGSTLLFPARLGAFELAVYRLVEAEPEPSRPPDGDPLELVNARYRARFDRHGDLVSWFDRRSGRELLEAPARLELFADRSSKYPAWEILWRDLAAGPLRARARVGAFRRLESGPLRDVLEIERALPGARLVERWSLAAEPAGDRLECAVRLDWSGRSRLLKSAWRFAVAAPEAHYDTGLSPVRRGVSSERLYEVPAQHWAALADPDGGTGVAVLSDIKSGWDHPDAGTLRSSWIHAPRASWKWRHQRRQDDGRHRFRFALAAFEGPPADGGVPELADRFVHPVLAFFAQPGPARALGRRWSPVALSRGAALVQALKASEDGEELILRWRNPSSRATRVGVRGLAEDAVVRRLDARERPSPAGQEAIERGPEGPEVEIAPGGLATLGVAAPPLVAESANEFRSLPLPLDLDALAARGEPGDRGFDDAGLRFPREHFPERIDDATVPFEPAAATGATALAADGQELELPPGFSELWLLAASVAGPIGIELEAGGGVRVEVPDWRAPLTLEGRARSRWLGGGVVPEAVRRVPLAWVSPFLRDRRGADRVAEPGMLFALRFPVAGATRWRLPRRPELRVVAATLAARPARPLAEATPLLD